jgi:branched-chain amino acid transport system ATP-binding protein
LELHDVSAGYGGTRVLHQIDLRVRRGGVVALLGANGAGKTTLLRVASGLLAPASGRVVVDGLDVSAEPPHRRVRRGLTLIPEGRGIFRSLTVRENLELLTPPWCKPKLEPVYEIFPVLFERSQQLAGLLSGGEQQMLALARAFLSQAKVVLLDEVSMGLAPVVVNRMFATMRTLAEMGVAMLLVEQYIGRALELSDSVYLIERGRITSSGTSGEIAQDDVWRAYIGGDVAPQHQDLDKGEPFDERHSTSSTNGRGDRPVARQ